MACNPGSKVKTLPKEKSSLSLLPKYGLRVRLIPLVFIAVVPALILILRNAKRDRDVSAENSRRCSADR